MRTEKIVEGYYLGREKFPSLRMVRKAMEEMNMTTATVYYAPWPMIVGLRGDARGYRDDGIRDFPTLRQFGVRVDIELDAIQEELPIAA